MNVRKLRYLQANKHHDHNDNSISIQFNSIIYSTSHIKIHVNHETIYIIKVENEIIGNIMLIMMIIP